MSTNGDFDEPVIDYVREVGNEAHEQLFPRPKRDGRQVLPLPFAVDFQPEEGIEFEVLFVPERIIKRARGEEAPDVRPSLVRVFCGPTPLGPVDLTFGKEPEIPEDLLDAQEADALMRLLRAVTGVE